MAVGVHVPHESMLSVLEACCDIVGNRPFTVAIGFSQPSLLLAAIKGQFPCIMLAADEQYTYLEASIDPNYIYKFASTDLIQKWGKLQTDLLRKVCTFFCSCQYGNMCSTDRTTRYKF